MFKVQKKDGSIVDFDRSKIINGVMKAGSSADEAEKVAYEVENWISSVAKDGAVNSADIRGKVLEILNLQNPEIAAVFEAYQKPAGLEEVPEIPTADDPNQESLEEKSLPEDSTELPEDSFSK